jgi:hypothetical protein
VTILRRLVVMIDICERSAMNSNSVRIGDRHRLLLKLGRWVSMERYCSRAARKLAVDTAYYYYE